MKQGKGFTLIELMIVLAIIGIIAALAYPNYLSFIQSAARSAAQADLMALAAAMERHKAANYRYTGAAASGADTGAPAIFAQHSPTSENPQNKKYHLLITRADNHSYLLEAEPVTGSSAEGNGALYLFSDGRKAWDQNNNGTIETNEYCWRC
jgi:type IV pilus assembly protein PilE